MKHKSAIKADRSYPAYCEMIEAISTALNEKGIQVYISINRCLECNDTHAVVRFPDSKYPEITHDFDEIEVDTLSSSPSAE